MRLLAGLLLAIFSSVLIIGCEDAVPGLYPPGRDKVTVHVVDHGYHTGIIVPAAEARHLLPTLPDLPDGAFLEIGWGDAAFYQARGESVPLALRALFSDTDAVLHIAAFNNWPRRYFPESDVVDLTLSRDGFVAMMQFIADSAALKSGRAIVIGPGLYGSSRFYQAQGSYTLFHTCNHWAAEAIRASGFPITPAYGVTSGNVMFQIERGNTMDSTALPAR